MKLTKNQIKSIVFGHAVADALGVPVEFYSRQELESMPVTDMRGYGTYNMPTGCFSDDTSMCLCELEVLAEKWDFVRIMENFGDWYYNGNFTPTGVTFDAGNTCVKAIESYFSGGKAPLECGGRDEYSNGNGSLMRIYPFVLYILKGGSVDDNIKRIHMASALTHAHERCMMACGIYALLLEEILKTPDKNALERAFSKVKYYYGDREEFAYYEDMFSEKFKALKREQIKSSGYVVDTLKAAVWCLLTTECYEECVLKAVNLGGDSDTVAAVSGALAGALYGFEKIPENWLEKLKRREYIEKLCEEFAD